MTHNSKTSTIRRLRRLSHLLDTLGFNRVKKYGETIATIAITDTFIAISYQLSQD